MSEDEWVRKAQRGDQAAFTQLVLAHERFVYNLALRGTGSPEDAEDVAQEAFLRAWLGLPRFRAQASFRTWLYRITTNLCYNRQPHIRRELMNIPVEEGLEGALPFHSDGPAETLDHGERKAYLHRQVESLGEGFRMMIVLRYQLELSYEEIAEIMEIPLGTVKTGLHRAHKQLRQALERYEDVRV